MSSAKYRATTSLQCFDDPSAVKAVLSSLGLSRNQEAIYTRLCSVFIIG
jgi:hypothetical protein